jgi:hypothetical protein
MNFRIQILFFLGYYSFICVRVLGIIHKKVSDYPQKSPSVSIRQATRIAENSYKLTLYKISTQK